MIQLMEDCKGSFEVTETCSNFEEVCHTQYGQKILQEFNAFCKNLSRLGLDIVATLIFFYKKGVYKKPRLRLVQN